VFWGLTVVALAYLVGSLLFGVVYSRLLKGKDIRNTDNPGGSGSVRQFGWGFGLLVGISDALKGVLVAYFVYTLSRDPVVMLLSAMAVVAGHNWPLYFGFRGGGGLAPAFGVTIYHFPLEFALGLVPALLAYLLYKHTSLPLYLPHVGPVPVLSVTGLLAVFFLVWQRHGLYPHAALLVAMLLPIAGGGYSMYLRDQRKRKVQAS